MANSSRQQLETTPARQQLENFWEDVENNSRRTIDFVVDEVMVIINAAFPFKTNESQASALKRSITKINKYLAKKGVWYRQETDSKDALSMQEMSLAAAAKSDFPADEDDCEIYLYAALIVLLLLRNDTATRNLTMVSSNDKFLTLYGSGHEFSELSGDDPATTILRRYGNCMYIGKSIISPYQNKVRLMRIASCLSEGAVYITGSGQSLATTRRSILYELITGVKKQKRKIIEVEPIGEVIPTATIAHNYHYPQQCDGLFLYPQSTHLSFTSLSAMNCARDMRNDSFPTTQRVRKSADNLSNSLLPLVGSGSESLLDNSNISFIYGANVFVPGVDFTGSFTTFPYK